jgi:hypothetical protein
MREDAGERFTFEKGLRDLAAEIRRDYGITSLKPGELRPADCYLVDDYWGLGPKRVRPRRDTNKP